MRTKRAAIKRRVLQRYSAEDRERLIREYHTSGQGKAAFCRDRQINLSTFCGWLKRASATGSGFAEVTLADLPADSVRERIEVHFPGGVRVFLSDPGSPAETARLIREVAGC